MASKKNKVKMGTYKYGIAQALIRMRHSPNSRNMKNYFKTNFKDLSPSWMETLTVNLQVGSKDQGWLNYNEETKYYTLNTKLLQLINDHGVKKAYDMYFNKKKLQNKKIKENSINKKRNKHTYNTRSKGNKINKSNEEMNNQLCNRRRRRPKKRKGKERQQKINDGSDIDRESDTPAPTSYCNKNKNKNKNKNTNTNTNTNTNMNSDNLISEEEECGSSIQILNNNNNCGERKQHRKRERNKHVTDIKYEPANKKQKLKLLNMKEWTVNDVIAVLCDEIDGFEEIVDDGLIAKFRDQNVNGEAIQLMNVVDWKESMEIQDMPIRLKIRAFVEKKKQNL